MHFLLEKGVTINVMPERLENSYILFYSIPRNNKTSIRVFTKLSDILTSVKHTRLIVLFASLGI